MAGSIFPDINPNTTSGTDLSNLLNDFKDYVASNGKGTVRDSNLLAGGLWTDDTDEGSDILKLRMYDGTADLELLRVNKSTGQVTISTIGDTAKILRDSDDTIPAILELVKSRTTGNQVLDGDEVGKVQFTGTTDLDAEVEMANIKLVATDNVTATTQGSDLIFETTPDGLASLAERMRLKGDGKLGIGTTSPDEELTSSTNDGFAMKSENIADDAIASGIRLQKKRVSGGGQTLLNDEAGSVQFEGTDSGGLAVPLAKIVTTVEENTGASAHGASMTFSVKQEGTETYVDAIKINKDGSVSIGGQQQNDVDSVTNLLHGGVTQDLFTIDSSVYGGFVAEILTHGISTDTRAQAFRLTGVWDGTNWNTTFEDTEMGGNGPVMSLNITDAATLDVNYDNQMNQGGFVSGRIHLRIRRFLA
jgi:hypothetical protein